MPVDGQSNDGAEGGAPATNPSTAESTQNSSATLQVMPAAGSRPGISPEALQQLPPEVRAMFAQFTATRTVSGPPVVGPDRLFDRIPHEQAAATLEKILDASKHEVECEHATRKSELESRDRHHLRNLVFAGVAAVLATGICVLCLVLDKDDLAKILISGLSGLVAGGIGGYGLGRSKGK